MSPEKQQYLFEGAAEAARQSVGAQAEMAAQIATVSLWRQQLRTIQKWALTGALALIAVVGIGLIAVRAAGHRRAVKTAKCNDGSWSYAAERSGACSSHGGVKVFYR